MCEEGDADLNCEGIYKENEGPAELGSFCSSHTKYFSQNIPLTPFVLTPIIAENEHAYTL